MLPYLTLIFVCQLLGELLVGALSLPVPGPVVGMVLLFVYLLVRGQVPNALSEVGGTLQKYMSLLFVPAGAGVMLHFKLIGDAALPIGAAIIISTVLTIGATALILYRLNKKVSNG